MLFRSQGGMLLGPGRPMADTGPYARLADAPRFRAVQVDLLDGDVRILLHPA